MNNKVALPAHPNVHSEWRDWSENETLHVAVAYSNPYRWNTRRKLLNNFTWHMRQAPNVVLHVGELAYGDRPFEVSDPAKGDAQFRSGAELFHKENILNETIKRTFPADWKYGAIIDGDFTFSRHDWALEAIHQLQHHAFVQLFSSYANLPPHSLAGSQNGRIRRGFAATYIQNNNKIPGNPNPLGWTTKGFEPAIGGYAGIPNAQGAKPWIPVGATGGAWAFTRDAFNTVGGLMDRCILGHADWFMAFGLVSEPTRGMQDERYHPNYIHYIHSWQEKAALLKQNIGFVDQFATHHFHGAMKNRGYESRDKLLVKYNFDPIADLRANWQGIYELTGNKPGLRDAIRAYFIARDEDNPNDGEN